MAWVAVDKNGTENIFQFHPRRSNNSFTPLYSYSMFLTLPRGSIKKLTGRDLTWNDEPIELKEND